MTDRTERVAEEIRREISSIIQNEIKDPRLPKMLSVLNVRVTKDLRHANISISVLGDKQQKEDALFCLGNAKGFIKKEISRRLRMRATPDLHFQLDESIERGMQMSKLIDDTLKSHKPHVMLESLDKACEFIEKAENIVILPHVSVDGDAVGSSLALWLAVSSLGKNAVVYFEEEIPGVYKFLHKKQKAFVYSEGQEETFDLAISIDTGSSDRLGKRIKIFNDAKKTLNIDHHVTNEGFAQYNYVDKNSAATGEILYKLIKLLGLGGDPEMAECMYVALATDTGGFRFSNTTPETHRIAAELVAVGLDVAKISQQIFGSVPPTTARLSGLALSGMEFYADGKIVMISITEEMMKTIGAKDEDSEGISGTGSNILGVEVSIVLKYKGEEGIKISMRSKSYVDVAEVCMKFNGGGHKRAAGCTIKGQLEEAKELILAAVMEKMV